jgi:hypothetical protein
LKNYQVSNLNYTDAPVVGLFRFPELSNPAKVFLYLGPK